MVEYTVRNFAELGDLLKRHFAAKDERLREAIRKTIGVAVEEIAKNVPVAFGELKDSIHKAENDTQVIVDAPHAAAVEVGSRPHWPPFQPILDWVNLKIATTNPNAVARAIQMVIAERGTKPTFFVANSLPEIELALLKYLQEAIDYIE